PRWVKYGKSAERTLAKEKRDETDYKSREELKLSPDQSRALEAIRNELQSPHPKPIILFGVTGSGKSEIYIRAIREVLKNNQSAICLVPEIALTEQIRRFFLHHFGNKLEILHSKLSDSDRFLAWKRLERGDRQVVLGPRSAVFAPLSKLGMIIIDEEHEGSYKQETVPRYHARDVALRRAENEKALVVMGSATPSLEMMYQAEKGKIIRIDLRTRIDEKAMPAVHLVDLKQVSGNKRAAILTLPLASEIQKNLERKEGTMLLLNRRGFSTHIHCPRCGHIETCTSCQVSLTFHQEDERLLCHYCNFSKQVPDACSTCGTNLLRFAGFGTEKVESEVAARWPQARIARLDADSVRKRGSHEAILKSFRRQEMDILIGTQMIAKGFDFPHVTLVGVILADVGLMLPDFRSSERTFQLLTQVAGRAGRGIKPGRVLVQTFSPDHPSVRFARQHDYSSFYRDEMPARFEHHYPPYYRLINFIVRAREEKKAYLLARTLRDLLNEKLKRGQSPVGTVPMDPVEIIGPSPLPFYKLRGHYRWHVMIKMPFGSFNLSELWKWITELKKPSGAAMAIDVDPGNIL
ncbi:MAG TPA: primosomal protein N', partial [bacterium]|nr:primosomal protein N' [bacterium]